MEEEALGKAYDSRLMKRLLQYLKPYWRIVAASLALLVVDSLLQSIGPLITKLAVDRYLVPSGHGQSIIPALNAWLSKDPMAGLTQLAILYLAIVLFGFVFDFGQTYLMQWTGQRAMFDLRRELMTHLQTLDVAYFDRNPVGRLVTRVTSDVDVLNDLFASGLVTIVGDLLALSFIVAVMFSLSPGLTAIMLGVLPLVVLVTMKFRQTAAQSFRRIRVAIAKINAYMQEHVAGIAVLQLFNRERKSAEEFESINRDHMLAFKDSVIAYGWFYPVVEFLGMLALALVLAYGGFRIRQGSAVLGCVGGVFPIWFAILPPDSGSERKVQHPAKRDGGVGTDFQAAGYASRHRGAVESLRRFPPARWMWSSITYGLPITAKIGCCKDVSFHVAAGETVAIVGHTGAGKTTLTNLLLRFYDVQRGAIRIGGIDIKEFDLIDLRQHFGVVLQDPYLFTGTIASNIRLGTAGITDEAVRDAADRVNLLDFVEQMPEQFATPVRERGQGLSTGQKQLISFARALAHDARILILDEATSSVDTETELRVREALNRLVENRTSTGDRPPPVHHSTRRPYSGDA